MNKIKKPIGKGMKRMPLKINKIKKPIGKGMKRMPWKKKWRP